MAGRPGKRLELIEGHLTKAQIAARREAEAALSGGIKMRMSAAVKSDKLARKYFARLVEIFEKIDMCDAAMENVINRYCIMLSEHDQMAGALAEINDALEREEDRDAASPLLEKKAALEAALRKLRDQLLAIEKENLLTAQSKIRAVPKQREEKAPSGIAAYRAARGG